MRTVDRLVGSLPLASRRSPSPVNGFTSAYGSLVAGQWERRGRITFACQIGALSAVRAREYAIHAFVAAHKRHSIVGKFKSLKRKDTRSPPTVNDGPEGRMASMLRTVSHRLTGVQSITALQVVESAACAAIFPNGFRILAFHDRLSFEPIRLETRRIARLLQSSWDLRLRASSTLPYAP